jgi:hypothetical protein
MNVKSVTLIIKKKSRKQTIPQMLVPPTKERANQQLGLRENHHRFSAIEPFEWLFERNVFGHKEGSKAQERLQTAKNFYFLYILNEEQPTRYAMLDWAKFILGMGNTSNFINTKETHQSFMLDRKKEYQIICKELRQGNYGTFGLLVLKKICAEGAFLKMIESQFKWPEGMAGIILRQTLDDIERLNII